MKKVFLEISRNLQENTCARVSFLIKFQLEACNFIKKDTPALVFSDEFCGNSVNTFVTEHLRTAASIATLSLFHMHVFFYARAYEKKYTKKLT